MVIYLVINDGTQIEPMDYLFQSEMIFEAAGNLGSMLFAIAFSTGLSYMIRHYLVEKFYQSLYDWCAETDAGDNIESMTNEGIALHASKPK